VAWTTDALTGVAWSPDADLTLQAAPQGMALVWRGLRGGKSGRTLAILGPHGESKGDPVAVGAAFCVTDAGVAWLDARAKGPTRIVARAWTDAAPRTVG